MLKLFVPLIALVCAPFLTGPNAYGQNHPDHPPLVTGPSGQMGIYGPDGKFIWIDDDPETVLGGKFSLGATPGNSSGSFAPPTLVSSSLAGTVTHYTVSLIPGSNWQESFLVGMPKKTGSSSLPVLVLFHGAYENEWSAYEKTDYFTLAMQRGWIVIAPLGAHTGNYGIEYSQLNVEAALEMLAGPIADSRGLTVDADRFYAVGFSMGGGAAASFAARHMDPSGLHFAGTVILSGTTSLPWVHWSGEVGNFFLQSHMFGAPPNDPNVTFDYLRVSSVDLAYPLGPIDPSTDMICNLTSTPVLSSYCKKETPSKSMVVTTHAAHMHLTYDLHGLNGGGLRKSQWDGIKPRHKWTNLKEKRVLDFLAPLSYQAPADNTWVSTLADRDGGWHGIEITQVTPEVFSPFEWKVIAPLNVILISEVNNIKEFKIPSPKFVGLDPKFDLIVSPNTKSMHSIMNVVLGEYLSKPSRVTINGNTAVEGTDWSYSAPEVTLVIPGTRNYSVWKVEI